MAWTMLHSPALCRPRPAGVSARAVAAASCEGWFEPFKYRDLIVRPAGSGRALGSGEVEDGAVASTEIVLKTSSAFGTGEHATTQLCLEFLRERELEGERVLDYGCGTGVLCIAAAKLGASQAVGVDVDPEAISATEENMEINGLTAEQVMLCGSGEVSTFVTPGSLDVCVVNMLFPEQVGGHISIDIASFIREGGALCVSGIRADAGDVEGVETEYGQFFTFAQERCSRGGWVRMIGERNATKVGATQQSIQELSERAME